MFSFHSAQGLRIPIFMYHQVVECAERAKTVRATNPAYTVTVELFREQMAWLSTNGYRTHRLEELITPGFSSPKGVVITFDDGWSDNHAHALPVLREYGLSATLFVVTGFVGAPGYVDWTRLREMASSGFSLQSHTVSHRPLETLKPEEIEEELGASKKTLEDRLSMPVDFVSMPQGSWNRRILGAAHEAGYLGVCTSEPGYHHRMGATAVFSRINIADRMPMSSFARIARMDRGFLLPVLLSTRLKRAARALLGHGLYRRLYRLRYHIREEQR